MRKRFLLALLPILCLPSCGEGDALLTDSYMPKADLPYVIRSGDAYVKDESRYDVMPHGQSVEKAVETATKTGETLLFYFYSQRCHFCSEIKESFAGFLEQTDIKVLAYTNDTSINYFGVKEALISIAGDSAKTFLNEFGTPLLFAYKDKEFSQIPIYGNHGSAKSIARMMNELYSYPYLYELSSKETVDGFLEKGYPVYLLEEGDELPEIIESSIRSSSKRFGYVPESKLSEEGKKEIEEAYGVSSRLLIDGENLKKEDCSPSLERYFLG